MSDKLLQLVISLLYLLVDLQSFTVALTKMKDNRMSYGPLLKRSNRSICSQL